MIAFMIICLLSILCGLCFLWGGLLAFTVFGIVGILLGATAYAWLNWNKINETGATPIAPIKKTVPRITSGWDYRPRKAIRRSTTIDGVTAEPAQVLGSSSRNGNDYVWFNALECSSDTLVAPSPDVQRARDEYASAANPETAYTADTIDGPAVPTYDQSPIDNQTAVAE